MLVGAAALLAAACASASTKPSDGPPTTRTPATKTAEVAGPVSPPHGDFSLVVKTDSGVVSANVTSMSVASREPVDAPHKTAEDWNTAVWVKQSTYPSGANDGTSYIYGHACHHHVCAFTKLKNAELGDQVTITTTSGILKYRINRIGLSPKTATSLPSWASDSTVPNRLVLVTCAFERGDTSHDNIVVIAQLRDS